MSFQIIYWIFVDNHLLFLLFEAKSSTRLTASTLHYTPHWYNITMASLKLRMPRIVMHCNNKAWFCKNIIATKWKYLE